MDDLLVHCNTTSSVSKLHLDTLQGLQLAPLSVKEYANSTLQLVCLLAVKWPQITTLTCAYGVVALALLTSLCRH